MWCVLRPEPTLTSLAVRGLPAGWNAYFRRKECTLPGTSLDCAVVEQEAAAPKRKKDSGPPAEEGLAQGLKLYLNKACRQLLLYPHERAAAEEVRAMICWPLQPQAAAGQSPQCHFHDSALCQQVTD